MRIFISTCIFIFLFNSGSHAIAIDNLSKTVGFLRQQLPQTIEIDGKLAELGFRYPGTKKFKPMLITKTGTGFIIRYNKRDYLVTAKHIAESFLPTGEIVINLSSEKSMSITFQWLSQQKIIKGAHWFHHPEADISVHPIAYNNNFDIMAINETLYQKQGVEITLLNSSYIVGCPLGLGALEKLSPVAKEAKIASKLTSIDKPRISPDLHFILLDQALSQGYSGAPVFYVTAPQIREHIRPEISDRGIVVNRGPAGVQPDATRLQGGKIVFRPREGIVKTQCHEIAPKSKRVIPGKGDRGDILA